MAFAALRQQDKLSESEWESFLPDGKDKGHCRGFQLVILCAVTVVVVFVASVISTNLIAKSAIEAIGTYAFGAKTVVGSVALKWAHWAGNSSINDIVISSPLGFDEDLIHFTRGLFDIGFWSVVGHTVFNVGAPFELEEVRVTGVHVALAQELDGTSNAGLVLHSMLQDGESRVPPPTTRAMQTRLIARRVSLENITASVAVLPVSKATGPITFGLNSIVLTSVGENSGGVTLEELLKDIVRVVLGAVIHHTGGDMKERIMSGLGSLKDEVMKVPHAKEILCDAGKGLESVHHWADDAEVKIADRLSPLVNYTEANAEAIGGMLSNVSAQLLPQVSAGAASVLPQVSEGAASVSAGVSSLLDGLLSNSGGDASRPAGASGISALPSALLAPLRSEQARPSSALPLAAGSPEAHHLEAVLT